MASFVVTAGLGIEDYADGVAFQMTFANVTVFDTDEGLILVDCGARTHARAVHVGASLDLILSGVIFRLWGGGGG